MPFDWHIHVLKFLLVKARPKTVYRLMLISFTLVAIPLVVGLVVLFFQLDRLSTQMQASVNQSAAMMENSRLLTAQALSLKRSAEQYLILRDYKLLIRYHEQRALLEHSLNAMMVLPITADMRDNLAQIKNAEAGLAAQLNDIDASQSRHVAQVQEEVVEKPPELKKLVALVEDMPVQANEAVVAAREDMAKRARQSKRSLIILLVTLVPAAILLALMSSAVINRPIKKIISVIHQLGEGEHPIDTRVGGPQNIEVLGAHLRWLSERLSQIEQQKMVFLQNISHELNTPLTALREGTDLLREQVVGRLNPEQIEILDIMNQNTQVLQTQLESLLDFNLALTLDEPYPQTSINLSTMFAGLGDKLQLILKSRQVSLAQKTAAVHITGNPAQLESLFENILTNAIKFSPAGGTITIEAKVRPDGTEVTVQDAGPGFHQDEVNKVFEPFFQGRKSRNSHIHGTGLGLAIAKRYANLHGGRIYIENSANGAAVSVFFPANKVSLARAS